MKIRIFALARDLGLDSKVLIDLCEEAGVKLRNALATISEEERDQVVAYIKKKGANPTAEIPPTEATPVRDLPNVGGRVRVIGVGTQKSVRPGSEEQDFDHVGTAADGLSELARDVSPVAEESPAVEEVSEIAIEDAAEVVEPAVAEEIADEVAAEVEAPAVAASTSVVEPLPPVSEAVVVEAVKVEATSAAVVAPPVAAEIPAAAVVVSKPVAAATPVSAPVVASPAAAESPNSGDMMRRPRMQQFREMRPIGSVKDREQAAAAAAARPAAPIKVGKEKVAPRPIVAARPDYVPPTIKKPKPKEERVQKPDMSLSELVDRRSPLADQLTALRKAREEHSGR